MNNTPLAVTVNSVVVKLGTCSFDMWPHGTVLQPGQQFIVTQTASGAADGCDNTAGFFDTSDIGPNGTGWSGHCDQSGVVPEVDATIDGVLSTFTDTGQVLNTGGVDKASCPNGSNESEQWTLIGSQPCPGATLDLAPDTQTQPVGSPATVRATLRNSCGTGLQGASIDFAVTSGPNAGQTGTAVTDTSGVASFTYTGTTPGTDTVSASATNLAGVITSNPVSVVWQKQSTHLVVNGATSGDFDDPATVAGVLTDSHGPLSGRGVTFTVNGTETCSGTTNASGAASCSLTPGEPVGDYPLTATFAGDATHLGTTATSTFTVTHEETTLTYTGPTKAANGAPLTLSGVLREDGATPIAGRTVTFTIGSGGSAQSCAGTTAASGSASCTIASVDQPAATTSVGVTAVFAGDTFYQPATASATLKFQYLTGRAYGLSAKGLVSISPTPDTGPVATAAATTVAPPCVLTVGGLIKAHTLCAKVTTTVDPGTSTATASVQDATIGVVGLPVIQIGLVQSASDTTCSASSGSVTVTSIKVGGIPLAVNLHPAPNTTISVLGITVVLNEQLPVAGADHGLTVNAVHVKAAGLLDVVLASATSDIHNC
ncbi:MAG TPA: choice-of-anchor P family protein [Pseudonocardiaceae bacterium]|nr:choice-of-anchor P family protein [Pseudonocardiaceae bacterium]